MSACRYGYQFEVVVDAEACVSAEKRFAMGRFGHGQSSVMPDNRTVYMSDEELGGGFFKFVANTAGWLLAGAQHVSKELGVRAPQVDGCFKFVA